mmetsp:Transcript_465/g.1516  ORF Transcript_465/g.1516 Transcript_465/m.1516 type:complete len:251 (+) Transcript_465:386-1138(+)
MPPPNAASRAADSLGRRHAQHRPTSPNIAQHRRSPSFCTSAPPSRDALPAPSASHLQALGDGGARGGGADGGSDTTDDILASLFGTSVEGLAAPRHQIMRVPRALFSSRGPPSGRAFLLALEQALWTELVSCLRLSRGHAGDLPEALLALVPPAPREGWSVPMPQSDSSEWLRRWDYPPVRRAQRLSFLMAMMLPQFDRQRLLEAASVRERLQLGVIYLGELRRRLVATRLLQDVPGVEDVEGGGSAFGI